jgi:hypothetical protein
MPDGKSPWSPPGQTPSWRLVVSADARDTMGVKAEGLRKLFLAWYFSAADI